jgi:archaellin
MKRSKTPISKQRNTIESPVSKKSIDLDKSSSSINEKPEKNNYILQYLKSKEKASKAVNYAEYVKRSSMKKETSKSTFDFQNDIKKELDKKLQYKKEQTANKIISSSPLHAKKESPKKIICSPLDLKRDLSPKKNFTELKIELTPTPTKDMVEKENGKKEIVLNQSIKPEFRMPDHRKFSILDIPAFYPEKNKVELNSRNKAYFLLANSELFLLI